VARDGKDAFYRTLKLDKEYMKIIKCFRSISQEMKNGKSKTDEIKDEDNV